MFSGMALDGNDTQLRGKMGIDLTVPQHTPTLGCLLICLNILLCGSGRSGHLRRPVDVTGVSMYRWLQLVSIESTFCVGLMCY